MGKQLSLKVFTVLALAVAVGLAVAISPFASGSPDGLEKVAGDKGFLDDATTPGVHEKSPIPDYAFPGIENEKVATGVAGFFGALGTFAIGYGLAFAIRRRRAGGDSGGPTPARA